ncbi:MAG: protein-S-isoprenylcysteine O-methyltransferase Ste14 [Mariniblastus sp.]|jgi:protein-S-isoprenylcysteine O-methyltransferase Ste14
MPDEPYDRLDLKILPLTLCLYMVMLGIVVHWSCNWFIQLRMGQAWGILGLLLMLLAYWNIKWCFRLFAAAKTHTNTTKPALTIVDAGPYRFSRNPMYASYVVGYAGLVLLMDSPVMFAVLVYFIYTLTEIVIKPEEQYLERQFGKEYLDYKNSRRRWI